MNAKMLQAIKDGRFFHLFNVQTKEYVASFYFQGSAKACAQAHGFNDEVKFISCEDYMKGGI